MFDTSDYAPDNQYGIPLVNRRIIGKFKDELKGIILDEYIGIRAKVYAIRCLGNDNIIKKHKGIGTTSIKNLRFLDFKNSLFHNVHKMSAFNTIRSINHKVYSLQINKVSLLNYDDKRKQMNDKIRSIPWGHYSLAK